MEIFEDLHQFTDYIPPIQLSMHQYLLLTKEPVLIHTGTAQQLAAIMPHVKELIGEAKLKYVFVSHFESDECGGILALQREFPEIVTVCSDICSRQLSGFGYTGKIMAKKAGDSLETEGYSFKFVEYPSEIHLQNGLLFLEEQRGIFFSSDLMYRAGDAKGKIMQSTWQSEVYETGLDRVANEDKLTLLKRDLLRLKPKFIAVGHGYCVDVSQ